MAYPAKTDRARILAAAMKQVEQNGLRAISLRALAASLDLTPNAIYRYFADRSALESALAGEVSRLLHLAMQRTARKASPEQAVRGIARAYLGFARKRPRLYEVLLLPCDANSEEAASHEELWKFVVTHVAAVAGPEDANEASIALWAYLHGFAQLEAAKAFGEKQPAKLFAYGLDAWLEAAAKRFLKK